MHVSAIEKINKISIVIHFSIAMLIFIFFANICHSQAVLPTSRTTWGTAVTGWTASSTSLRNTTFACSGDNALIFDNTNDRITVFLDSDPDVLTFKLKKSSMSGNSYMTVETSSDGISWTSVGIYGTATTPAATAITDCGNININMPCGVRYIRWTYTKSSGNCDLDDVSITKKAPGSCCTISSEPTTNASAISVTPGCFTAEINFTGGDGNMALIVMSTDCTITNPTDQNSYSANSAFGSGSTTAAGDYVVYNNTGSTVTVSGLSSGTNYCLKIYEYNGTTANCEENYLVTSVSSTSFTTLSAGCVAPHLTGVMINSCVSAGCSEGDTEIIYGNAGDYSFVANSTNLAVRYDATSPATTTYTNNLVTNTTKTAALNTAAGCAGTFVEGTGATIPVGGKFMIIDNAFCVDAYSWTQFCGNGPVYVIYSTDADWNSTGNFGNDPAATSIRYFGTSITTSSSGTMSLAYSYNTASLSPYEDGDYILFDQDGGAASAYGNNDCIVDPILLPIQLNYLNAVCLDERIQLSWQTGNEVNNSHFTVEATNDGYNFIELRTIKGAGNSNSSTTYFYNYDGNATENLFFRLKQTDYDGYNTYSDLITAQCNYEGELIIYPNPSSGTFIVNGYPKNAQLVVLNDLGQQIITKEADSYSSQLDLSIYSDGIYILKIVSSTESQTIKLILSK